MNKESADVTKLFVIQWTYINYYIITAISNQLVYTLSYPLTPPHFLISFNITNINVKPHVYNELIIIISSVTLTQTPHSPLKCVVINVWPLSSDILILNANQNGWTQLVIVLSYKLLLLSSVTRVVEIRSSLKCENGIPP